jgi:hypothetical protein
MSVRLKLLDYQVRLDAKIWLHYRVNLGWELQG